MRYPPLWQHSMDFFLRGMKNLFVALLITLSVLLMRYGTAQAHSTSCIAVNCNLIFQFDGTDRTAGGWGAKATVGDYLVNGICISSSAWTMIDNTNYANSSALAQVGYLRLASWSTNTTYYFYEYGDGYQLLNPVMLGVDTKNWGASDQLTTYYNSGNGYIQPQINNVTQAYINVGWGANDQEWFAETHANEDHVVGGNNYHSLFGSVSYLYSGKWYTINTASYMIDNSTYGSYSTSGSSFYVWDTRVS